jgi:hypothetical protein
VKKIPSLIQGDVFEDSRGILKFNNEFDASEIKRIYQIENHDLHFVRGWQGHTIEKRWFSVFNGSFRIWVASANDFTDNKLDQRAIEFILGEKRLAVLHVPAGYLTAIQSSENKSKLLVMSDYKKGELNDELRFLFEPN